ncbi:hypothetical protein V8G54_013711 [Vigna mungo]|uniref:Piwi domain-containing protein n=1 Tax=Vigna mungo TaxID=3915 RepID=A0AAQ3RYM9_VIGMU
MGTVSWFLAALLTVNNQYLTNISLKINVKLGGLNSILPRRDFLSVLSVSEAPTMIIGIDSFVGSVGESIPSSVVVIVHKGLGIGHREGLVEVRGLGQSKGSLKNKVLAETGTVSWCLAALLTVKNEYFTNSSLKINVKLGGLNSVLPRRDFLSVLSISEAPTVIIGIDSFKCSSYSTQGQREGLVKVRGLGQSSVRVYALEY